MRNREFREIQVSSSLLVVIFLSVLALGVFIFLLGVSVGKKQVQIMAQSNVAAQRVVQSPAVSEEKIYEAPKAESPAGQDKTPSVEDAAGKTPPQKVSEESQRMKPGAAPGSEKTAEKPAVSPSRGEDKPAAAGLFYVQVGAYNDRASANAAADAYRKQGHSAVVKNPFATDRRSVFRVWLGGFPSRDLASGLLLKLNAAAGKKTGYYIVKG